MVVTSTLCGFIRTQIKGPYPPKSSLSSHLVDQILGAFDDVLHLSHVHFAILTKHGKDMKSPLCTWCLLTEWHALLEIGDNSVTNRVTDDGTALFEILGAGNGWHVSVWYSIYSGQK